MTMVDSAATNSSDKEPMTFEDFLSNASIGHEHIVSYDNQEGGKNDDPLSVKAYKVKLYCKNCDTQQNFSVVESETDRWTFNFHGSYRVLLVCNNCLEYFKTFLIDTKVNGRRDAWDRTVNLIMKKLAEHPQDFERFSSSELSLLGSERDEFFKGLNCERAGLGAAAFLYYRRVVEKRRDKIFDQIIKVLNDSPHSYDELIQELGTSKSEGQFVKSIEKIKAAFPDSLLISGQNPLKLLYSALSEGVHELSDEECLEYAEDVRVVLLAMSERIDMLLSESKNINGAIKRLSQRVNKKAAE